MHTDKKSFIQQFTSDMITAHHRDHLSNGLCGKPCIQIPGRDISGFLRQASDIATSDGCALKGRGSELEVPEFHCDHRRKEPHCGDNITFMKKVILQMKEMLPELKVVHYILDSPSSQYRNKNMVAVMANHQQEFGLVSSYI